MVIDSLPPFCPFPLSLLLTKAQSAFNINSDVAYVNQFLVMLTYKNLSGLY